MHTPHHLSEQATSKTILSWLLQAANSQHVTTSTCSAGCSAPTIPQKVLWAAPTQLLAQVSSRYLEFFQAYIKMLTSLVDELQAQANEDFQHDVWPDTQQQYMEKLTSDVVPHLKALLTVPKIKEVTYSLIKSQEKQAMPKLVSIGLTKTADVPITGLNQYPVNLWKIVLGLLHGVLQDFHDYIS